MDQYRQQNQYIDDASAFTQGQTLEPQKIIIKAVGVGGGGNNAINHMYREGIQSVSFANINTDRQALNQSPVPTRLEIGDGLGAGNDPVKARQYAEDAVEEIERIFDDDTKMVFITAGMGGGTGTGAGPVVARLAKERGLLTIGIVTIPFMFEGPVKIKKAIAGADEMAKYVDALLVINNERLNEIYGDLDFINAFGKADDTLSIAARSISELITSGGLINLDFNDVNSTLRDGGAAIISTGYGEGVNRVTMAIKDALNSPLLKNRDIMGSKKLLFNIYFNPNAEEKFLMAETNELTDFISSINTDVDVIWGVGYDESLGNSVKITILAAGFDVTLGDDNRPGGGGHAGFKPGTPAAGFGSGPQVNAPQQPQPQPVQQPVQQPPVYQQPAGQSVQQPQAQPPVYQQPVQQPQRAPQPPQQRVGENISDERVTELYGSGITKDRNVIVLTREQMDDEMVCDVLERNPTFKRARSVVESVKNPQSAAQGRMNNPSSPYSGGGNTNSFQF